jgi:cell division protein FtsL
MLKRYKDRHSILKHPKIKLKIEEKVLRTIRIEKIFIVAMMLVTTMLLVIMVMIMMK